MDSVFGKFNEVSWVAFKNHVKANITGVIPKFVFRAGIGKH